MNIKIPLCNCESSCASFQDADVNALSSQVESEFDVNYSVVHIQGTDNDGTTRQASFVTRGKRKYCQSKETLVV